MRRHDALALAALAAAVAIFFAPALFADRAVFSWNMDLWHPWAERATPEDRARPTRLADCARQFYVMRFLLDEAIDEGRIPLWNRRLLAGTPFLANFQPGVFYPPNLALAKSGWSVLAQMDWFAAFHSFAGAAGVYLLLRQLGTGSLAAAIGAITFAGGGFNAARFGMATMVATGCWLPWALLASRRWFERGDAIGFAGMAGSLGLSGLAGFAQIFVFVAYGWGFFGLVEGLARRPRPTRSRWIGWGAAAALGLGLVAVHVVPTVEFMGLCTDAANPPGMLASGTLHPWAVAKWIVPDLLGHPTDGNNASWLLHMGDAHYTQTEHSTAVYAGILPLLLGAVVLLAPGERRRESLAALLLTSVGVLLCLDTPLSEHLGLLPGLGFSRPDRATLLSGFGLALLAGLGADRLAGREGPGRERYANVFALFIAACALFFALFVATLGSRVLPPDVVRALGDASIRRAGLSAAAIISLAGVLVLGRVLGRLTGPVFLVLALAFVTLDIGSFAARMNVMQPEAAIYRAPKPGDALSFVLERQTAEGPFRIFRYEPVRSQFRGVLPPSTASVYGFEDALGFDSLNLDRYRDVLVAIDPEIGVRRGNFRGTGDPLALASPVLDLLGVRYVLAEPRVTATLKGLELAHRSDLAVFENRDYLPRAFLVEEVRVLPEAAAILAAMADASFRPDLWAYSEVPIPELPRVATSGAARDRPAGRVSVVRHRDEEVVLRVASDRPSLLVLTDCDYPGWRCSVDGQARPIHRVDHAFRGVVVNAGDREVVFEYEPGSFRGGAAVSLLSLAAIGIAAVALRRSSRGRPA